MADLIINLRSMLHVGALVKFMIFNGLSFLFFTLKIYSLFT